MSQGKALWETIGNGQNSVQWTPWEAIHDDCRGSSLKVKPTTYASYDIPFIGAELTGP